MGGIATSTLRNHPGFWMRADAEASLAPIPGYEGRYSASADGHVWSNLTGRFLKPYHSASGHLHVALHKDGKQRSRLVHRLVALAFLGEPPEGTEVCHNDGDPVNNSIQNLRYGTRSENMYDRVKHGDHPLAAATHCKWGHEFNEGNTRVDKNGRRACRACAQRRREEYRARTGKW